jgi:hypothetical protein
MPLEQEQFAFDEDDNAGNAPRAEDRGRDRQISEFNE